MPPEKPVVVDRWGRVINTTTLGPHEEGDDVLLTCRVLGGKCYHFIFSYTSVFDKCEKMLCYESKSSMQTVVDLCRFIRFQNSVLFHYLRPL